MNEQRGYRGGFVWPVILIGAGVLFLLNNLGVIGWGVWETLLRLWPVLLIAVGLDILVGRRFPLGSVLLGIVVVAVLVLAARGSLPLSLGAGAANVDRTETVSQDLQGVERASVDIDFGAGNLKIGALTEGSAQLIQGTVDLSRSERLDKDYRASSGVGYYTLKSEGPSFGPIFWPNQGKTWSLDLSRDVPLDLVIDAGAGETNMDLTALSLRRFELDGGVGQVTVKLPARGRYDVDVNGGVGQVILIFPEGLAARVRVDGGLGGVTAEGDFRRQNDDYVVGDFDTAENRADVQVDGGVGQLVIRTLGE